MCQFKLSLIFLILSTVACREDLVHLNSEVEANRVLFALMDKGIVASKSSIGKEWLVRIEKSDLVDALRVLENQKIFQEQLDISTTVDGGIFKSKEDKKNTRDRELARSLSSSIKLFPFVREARVHIYDDFTDPLAIESKNERSASVLIVQEAGEVNEEVVRELISRGAGLDREKVSVLFVKSPNVRPTELSESEIEPAKNSTEEKLPTQALSHNKSGWRQSYQELRKHLSIKLCLLVIFLLIVVFTLVRGRTKGSSASREAILKKLNKEGLKNEHI